MTELDIYPWMAAPSHLKTRRQLRAAGLRPNGQEPAAVMRRMRRGREVTAYLYDVAKAAPKRTASPAQLLAVAKAVRAHQIRAAERRGLSATDLDAAGDPGPAWTTEKGNTMSDNTETAEAAAEIATILAKVDQLAADGAIPTHLAQTVHAAVDAGELPMPEQLGVPTGPGQQLAYLFAAEALAAADRRRVLIAERDEAITAADPEHAADLSAERAAELAAVEQGLGDDSRMWWRDQFATVDALTTSLTWHEESDVAAATLTKIRDSFESSWGVVIDVQDRSVSIDPGFDPAANQALAEAAALWARESTVVDFVSSLPLNASAKAEVLAAVSTWRGESLPGEDPGAHLTDAGARRAQLAADLAAVKMSPGQRSEIEFVVDYLRGDVTGVDLLATPVYVDPGEEMRGRAAKLLEGFATGTVDGSDIAEQISVMTQPDQETLRGLGRALHAGAATEESLRVWPEYVDREILSAQLAAYVDDHAAFREAAVDAVTSRNVGADMAMAVSYAASRRDWLDDAVDGRGLAVLEQAQLRLTIDDIEAGRITRAQDLPELMWVDERSKLQVDQQRTTTAARELADGKKEMITALLAGADLTGGKDNHLPYTTSAVAETFYTVAVGAPQGVDEQVKRFKAQTEQLGRELRSARAGADVRTGVQQVVDSGIQSAWQLGQAAAKRGAGWKTKIGGAIATRDHKLARQAAVDATASHTPSARDRACRNRPERSAAAARAAAEPARVGGRRNFRGEGIER
ncbi:RRQRL motif-containing zinc-binding protein [Nocardia sp. NPDC087230]|uniref:RRQRL motif-containing zinc-binding protein n=1 Tax=Nocardia sp. NPDC087230 TaxID=3364331 RepID=UPI003815DD4B